MFTTAVVKRPCQNLVNGISSAHLGTPEFARACQQHDTYIQALETCGLSVTVLAPDEAFPDSTFIEDTCLVTEHCIVITRQATRPGKAKQRRLPMPYSGLTGRSWKSRPQAPWMPGM